MATLSLPATIFTAARPAAQPLRTGSAVRGPGLARPRGFAVLRAEPEDGAAPSSSVTRTTEPETVVETPATPSQEESGSSNGLLAGGGVAIGVVGFLAARMMGPAAPSFAALEAGAVPLDVALANGKPTVVEFYADWCEVCKEMLPQTLALEKEHANDLNFVLLNVDNPKWRPEMIEFGVRGIPEYVFIDAAGQPQAATVGRLPAEVLQGDVEALAKGTPLPYARIVSDANGLEPPSRSSGPRTASPRDHA